MIEAVPSLHIINLLVMMGDVSHVTVKVNIIRLVHFSTGISLNKVWCSKPHYKHWQ